MHDLSPVICLFTWILLGSNQTCIVYFSGWGWNWQHDVDIYVKFCDKMCVFMCAHNSKITFYTVIRKSALKLILFVLVNPQLNLNTYGHYSENHNHNNRCLFSTWLMKGAELRTWHTSSHFTHGPAWHKARVSESPSHMPGVQEPRLCPELSETHRNVASQTLISK